MQGRDESTVFVLDASVIFNFLGSGAAERLLSALPGSVLMANLTFQEVLRDPSGCIPPAGIRQALADTGLVEIRSLDDTQIQLYLELTSAPNRDRLDDGEAATVALAVGCGASPVLDEAKAHGLVPLTCGAGIVHKSRRARPVSDLLNRYGAGRYRCRSTPIRISA